MSCDAPLHQLADVLCCLCEKAKEDVSEAETHDVKFKATDGLILEAMLVVFKVPAAPATWQLRLDEVHTFWAVTWPVSKVTCPAPFSLQRVSIATS